MLNWLKQKAKDKEALKAAASDLGQVVMDAQRRGGLGIMDAPALLKALDPVLKDDGAPVHKKLNAAAALMLDGKYPETIAAYRKIADDHPGELATCQAQIGAAHFFLGHHLEAIELYRAAAANGEDAMTMAENIAEAEAAMKRE